MTRSVVGMTTTITNMMNPQQSAHLWKLKLTAKLDINKSTCSYSRAMEG